MLGYVNRLMCVEEKADQSVLPLISQKECVAKSEMLLCSSSASSSEDNLDSLGTSSISKMNSEVIKLRYVLT